MNKKKLKKIEIINTPTTFTDGAHIACRQDGMVLLQLFNELPGETIETHRTMMPNGAAKALANAILKSLDDLDNLIEQTPVKKETKD